MIPKWSRRPAPGSPKPTVAVDLDGVLASYDGWKGVDIIGDPIPGAQDFIGCLLSSGLRVIIHTTRTNAWVNRAEHNGQDHLAAGGGHRWRARLRLIVSNWLMQNGFPKESDDFYVYDGPGKPIAVAYVDDRAVACAPQNLAGSEPGCVEAEYQRAIYDIFRLCPEPCSAPSGDADPNKQPPTREAVPPVFYTGLKILVDLRDLVDAMLVEAAKSSIPTRLQRDEFEARINDLAARLGSLDSDNFCRPNSKPAAEALLPTLPGIEAHDAEAKP